MKLNVISSKMKSNFLKNNFVFIILILFVYFQEIKLMKFELSEKVLLNIKKFSIMNITKTKDINTNITLPMDKKINNEVINKNISLKTEKIVVSNLAKINNKLNRINELINRYEQFNNFTKNKVFFNYSKFKFRVDNITFSKIDSTNNASEMKPYEYSASLSIIDEMERNTDEREKLYYYRIFLVLTFLTNMFMSFTWKLSRKHKKFPADLVNSIFFAYNIKTMLILIMQSIKRDPLFEKIAFTIYIFLDYFTIFVNIFYLFSVISLSIARKVKTFISIKLYIKYLYGILLFIIQLAILIIIFFVKLNMKNCFVGACLINYNLKYYLEVLPRFIEVLIISCFIFVFLVYSCCSTKPIQSSELDPHTDQKSSMEKVNENSSISKVILYEIIYISLCGLESGIKYSKIYYYSLYRFEDYCSIHDYMIIIKSFLLFFFLGVSSKNLDEWIKAFQYYEQFQKEDIDLIDDILSLKEKYFFKRNKLLESI